MLPPDTTTMRQARGCGRESAEAGERRQTESLAALAVVLLLVVVCLGLLRVLRHEGRVEDCLMTGRTNCAEAVPFR